MKRIFKLFSLTIVFAFLVTQMGMSATPAYATTSGLTFTVISPSVPSGWTQGELDGVWGSSASNVYAVGSGVDSAGFMPLIYQYNGSSWTSSGPSLPSGGWISGSLSGVWGSSASNVYAVGVAANSTQGETPLIYQNTGSGWTDVSPNLPSGWTSGVLSSVWGSSASNVYAVGSGNNSTANVALLFHYDGKSWTNVSLALPSGWTYVNLSGMWGSDANNVYAVGECEFSGEWLPIIIGLTQNGAVDR